jgi:hypothetical protein
LRHDDRPGTRFDEVEALTGGDLATVLKELGID